MRTTLGPNAALERLRSRVTSPRVASSISGDYRAGMGVVGVFKSDRFDLRLQRFMANPYAAHAFGVVQSDPAGSRVEVRFARKAWATWVRRFFMFVFFPLLIAVQLLGALRQPVFSVGVGFLAVIWVLLFWSTRMRSEDRVVLSHFIEQSFADVRAS